jgi:hypothetical protein
MGLIHEEDIMKLSTLALAAALSLSSTLALAHSTHRHHHHRHTGVAATNPNGTAGGPTSLSGTGSSSYGGSVPGATGHN